MPAIPDESASDDFTGDHVPTGDSAPTGQAADPTDDRQIEAEQETDAEPEFSLSQLSEAYAEVIEAQTGVRPTVSVPADKKSEPDELGSDQTHSPDDNAACPISPESIIESILFVGAPQGVKLTTRKIASTLRDVSPQEVDEIVQGLNEKYDSENAAYRIASNDGGLAMVLDTSLQNFQQEFFGRNRQIKLSQAAVEVMALVAYNQPITREQIDALRNKPSNAVLKQLLKRQLILKQSGIEDPNVTYYATADRFLDLFHLETIADLPQTHDVAEIGEFVD